MADLARIVRVRRVGAVGEQILVASGCPEGIWRCVDPNGAVCQYAAGITPSLRVVGCEAPWSDYELSRRARQQQAELGRQQRAAYARAAAAKQEESSRDRI